MDGLLVPSSIQRIRSFLVEMCGMKVKPWASTEETLASLHATLVARGGCDIFWTSLRGLLETLSRDLKARREAAPGQLVDNEILDGERYTALLEEIRTVLARQAEAALPSTFRQLAKTLSTPALGLLLLLGGAASVGCGREAMQGPAQARDAALSDTSSSQPQDKTDGKASIPPPDASDVQPNVGPDSSVYIRLDTRLAADKPPSRDAANVGPDGATITIQDIMDSCGLGTEEQGRVLTCLRQMRSSWSTGMAEVLAGQDCARVASDLDCFGSMTCTTATGTEFDPASTPICQPVILYFGVRFV
jgi:hypothetical protein